MADKKRNRSTEARTSRATTSKAEEELKALRTEQELQSEREAMRLAEEATAQAKADLELDDLVFDWSDLSMRDSQELSMALTALGEAEREYDHEGNYISLQEREEAQREAYDQMAVWLSRVCASLPMEWFTKSTQKAVADGERTLDFADPSTYDDLQSVRVGRLLNAMNESRGASEKN